MLKVPYYSASNARHLECSVQTGADSVLLGLHPRCNSTYTRLAKRMQDDFVVLK
jgi:hypothetical protein